MLKCHTEPSLILEAGSRCSCLIQCQNMFYVAVCDFGEYDYEQRLLLSNIHLLVCLMETQCVLCEV
jgi:hypothetical protein